MNYGERRRYDDDDDDEGWDYSQRMYMNPSELSAQPLSPKRSPKKSPKRNSTKKNKKTGWNAFAAWWTTPTTKKGKTAPPKRSPKRKLAAQPLVPQPVVTQLAVQPIVAESKMRQRRLAPMPLEPFNLASPAWVDWFRGHPTKKAPRKRMGAAETRPQTPKFGKKTVNAGMKKPQRKKAATKRVVQRTFGRKA